MAGLSVLLEPHSKSHPGNGKAPAQIISKATLAIHHKQQQQQQQQAPVPATAAGSFLQRCCLCLRELAEGRDIYMYRGDRAFCSEECRCRQILMDEDAGNGAGAAAVRGRRRVTDRGRAAN